MVAPGSINAPCPSYNPRAIEMFFGDRRATSPVFNDPTHTNGSGLDADSFETNPER
jgi:hypothetical protein